MWTPEQEAFLREQHRAGFSAREIADLFKEKYDVIHTRSAIIGKIYRLGETRRKPSAPVIV